jgi:4-diphosphocytidyl-2-C-methyl-D-erythritol kinase
VTSVTVRAPAKINLALSVGALDDDGYHQLATVYQAIGLFDEIKARPAADGEFTIGITGEGADTLPLDETNLALVAARALADECGVDDGVALHVHKTIAVASGLAGGSADAAGALVACDALWGLHLPRERLVEIAESLGSDVPFCLTGGIAIGSGRGEILSPVLARGGYEWVLAYSNDGLSTPMVYAALDELRGDRPTSPPEVPEALLSALRSGDPYDVGSSLDNDLQGPALRLRPSLRRTLDLGDEVGALGAMVSGSGPTCLFLAADDEHAVDIAVALSSSGLCRLVLRASGPVPGPRVIA